MPSISIHETSVRSHEIVSKTNSNANMMKLKREHIIDKINAFEIIQYVRGSFIYLLRLKFVVNPSVGGIQTVTQIIVC